MARRKRDAATINDRAITWGDLIEATEETIRRNLVKNQQLVALAAELRRRQAAGDEMPIPAPAARRPDVAVAS